MDKAIRKKIEKKLGYRFRKRKRLEAALTHPSFRHENEGIVEDNQRLEFLGDAALGLAAAADVYTRYGDENEGKLTDLRSQLTNRTILAKIGAEIGLGEFLQLGKGEERSGGRTRASNITDAVEAVLGAVYLDGGQKAVEKIYKRLWHTEQTYDTMGEESNPKGQLQEYVQKRWKVSPQYSVIEEHGPAHEREYVCVARIKEESYGTGRGSNKRTAEAEAARETLRLLEQTESEQS